MLKVDCFGPGGHDGLAGLTVRATSRSNRTILFDRSLLPTEPFVWSGMSPDRTSGGYQGPKKIRIARIRATLKHAWVANSPV